MNLSILLRNIGAFLLSSLFFVGCQNDNTQKQPPTSSLPSISVEIYSVGKTQVMDQIEVMGTVQAAQKAVISSRISGNIIELAVAPGTSVQKDEKLVQINAGEISAQLMQAKAQHDQAIRNLKREKKLFQQKAATSEAVKALEDAEKIALANLQEAGTMLGYTTINAPFSGLITKKIVDVGDLATPGRALLHMENEDELQILADVPESIVLNLQIGMEMNIEVPTAGLNLLGKISEIAPAADSLSRTVPIKLDIEKHEFLRSGQFARVTLPGSKVETILVPPDSIVPLGQMERVFIAVDKKARLRLVRTGKRYLQGVEILSGLSQGDQLILAHNNALQDGQPIDIQ